MTNATLTPASLSPATQAKLRFAVYWMLILTSSAVMVGRILTVESERGSTPFLGANDRSRWLTVRALVDQGTYEIDGLLDRSTDWYTIDRVRHKGPDGELHDYSSKPPLLSTILAGEYWLIKTITGATLEKHPFYVARIMLIVTNVIPLVIALLLIGQMAEKYGRTVWGRMFVMTCAAWGTFVTTFAVTINNHIPAIVGIVIALRMTLAVWTERKQGWHLFILAGLFAAFAAANELPAASFLAVATVAVLIKSPLRTIVAFLPAAAIVAGAFFYTNYLAHGTWKPAYAHRDDGQVLATLDPSTAETLDQGNLPAGLETKLSGEEISLSRRTEVRESPILWQPSKPVWKFWAPEPPLVERRWAVWDPESNDRLAIVQPEGGELQVRKWGNWYDFEGTDWMPEKRTGVDKGEPSRIVYALNILIGHYGVFSLTPLWAASLFGLGMLLGLPDRRLRLFAVMVLVLFVVCVAFYVMRPLQDRNYGGVSCTMRWLMWFTPFFLVGLLPAADAMSNNRWWRLVALVLLVAGVISATIPAQNPWQHPWLYQYWQAMGWLPS